RGGRRRRLGLRVSGLPARPRAHAVAGARATHCAGPPAEVTVTDSVSVKRWWPAVVALAGACGDDISPSDGTASSTAASASDSVGATSTSSAATTGASSGEPFDITPWVGRYHFEDPFHPFGQSNE